jgi:O-antigen ligase
MNTVGVDGMRVGDSLVAAAAVALCGAGTAVVLVAAASAQTMLAITGAALLGAGLTTIFAGKWLPTIPVLVITLPLPAVYATGDIRIAPVVLISAVILAAWALHAEPAHASSAVRLEPSVRRCTLALLMAVVIAALGAQDRVAAARELLNWLLLIGVFLYAVRELRDRPGARHTVAVWIGIAGAVCGPLAVLQALGVLPGQFPLTGSGLQRATLGFGWPNELGMFFAMALPFVVYLRTAARSSATQTLAVLAIAATVFGMIATFSRGSWTAALLAPVVLVVTGARGTALRAWAAAAAIGLAADALSGGAISYRIAATIGDWVIEQRAALTLAGIVMFIENPLIGVGPGGFEQALESYGPRISWLFDYLPTAQNGYVQIAAEAGLLGLVAFVALLAVVLRILLRSARDAAESGHADAALRRTVAWAFTTAVLLAFNEWIFAHGIGQLVLLTAALGITAATRHPDHHT